MMMTAKEIYTTHRLQQGSNTQGAIMDISKLESFVSQVKSMQTPRWASRKMLITLSIIGAMIWLVKGAIATILWQVTLLAGLWLLCTTATDIVEKHYNSQFKNKLLDVMAKDGLSKDELDTLNKTI
jgi:hypothetical protein